MISIALLALAFLVLIVVGMALIGSAFRYSIGRLFRGQFEPAADWTSTVLRLIEDIAIGLALIPVVFLVATAAGLNIGEGIAFGLLVLSAAVLVYRIVWDRDSFGVLLRHLRAPGRLGVAALGVVLALVLADRLVPYAPFLVYSGDDIRMFTLVTELLRTNGGPPLTSWGAFAGPNWNVVVDNHLTFSGSESIFAVMTWWVPGNIPQMVSATVIAIAVLIPLGAYVFLSRLFPDRDPSLPIFGALAFGVFSAYPLYFLQWGGIDDTVGWFLFPVSLGFLLVYVSGNLRKVESLVLGALVFAGAVASNPLSAFYVGTFLVALFVATLLFRTQVLRSLIGMAAFLALAVLLVSPLVYSVASSWHAAITALPPGTNGWGTWQTNVILRPGDWPGSIGRLFELNTSHSPVLFVTVGGLLGLLWFCWKNRFATTLLLWLVALLLVNSNGPFGLYFIKYPLWDVPYPDRTADIMFLPFSGGLALLLSELWVRAAPALRRSPGVPAEPTVNLPTRKSPRRGAAPWLVAMVAVMTVGTVAATEIGANNYVTVAWGNPFTPQDAAGFEWIQSNVPHNATILVTSADSGTWIPEFTGVRVFPYPELINNPTVVNVTSTIPSLFNTTAYQPALGFLREYNTSYVYFGERTEYSIVRGLNVPMFVEPTPVTPFLRSAEVCASPANDSWLSLTCNNDSATFRGPVVLSLTEFHGGGLLGVARIAIPSEVDWTFVLHSGTPEWPGNWSVTFSEHPIGSTVFEDGNVFILQLDPFFLDLVSDASAVLNKTVSGTVPQI